jgi:hypothetical protein
MAKELTILSSDYSAKFPSHVLHFDFFGIMCIGHFKCLSRQAITLSVSSLFQGTVHWELHNWKSWNYFAA